MIFKHQTAKKKNRPPWILLLGPQLFSPKVLGITKDEVISVRFLVVLSAFRQERPNKFCCCITVLVVLKNHGDLFQQNGCGWLSAVGAAYTISGMMVFCLENHRIVFGHANNSMLRYVILFCFFRNKTRQQHLCL